MATVMGKIIQSLLLNSTHSVEVLFKWHTLVTSEVKHGINCGFLSPVSLSHLSLSLTCLSLSLTCLSLSPVSLSLTCLSPSPVSLSHLSLSLTCLSLSPLSLSLPLCRVHPEEPGMRVQYWSEKVPDVPRYTFIVVDVPKSKAKNGLFAIFIVPQGR